MNDSHIYDFRLEVDIPERIDKLLAAHFPEYSRSTIQRWISNNDILINGKACTQKDKVTESCNCLLYTSPSPRDGLLSRMPSSA